MMQYKNIKNNAYIIIGFTVILIATNAISALKNINTQMPIEDSDKKQSPPIKKKFQYYGYYPSWKYGEFPPEKIPANFFSGIMHAFIWPDKYGKLIIPNDFKDKTLAKTMLQKGESVSISIGGWGNSSGFNEIAENPIAKDKFIRELKNFIAERGYNGIDLDWEYPIGPNESKRFITLANDIRKNLPGIRLTTALPIGLQSLNIENIEQIQKAFDMIFVMAYDIEDGGDGYAGLNAPLYVNDMMLDDVSIDNLLKVNYLDEGVPANKIILGIPLYGRKYDVPNPYDEIGFSKDIQYKDIPFGECGKNRELGSPVLMCGKSYISYDDQKSIEEKIRFAKSENLGGVFFWAIGQDNNKLIYGLRNKINKPTKSKSTIK